MKRLAEANGTIAVFFPTLARLALVLLASIGINPSAHAAPPARIQTFVRSIDIEVTKNPIFHALEGLAERHGFEIYFEKETADSLFRVVGADFVQTQHSRPDLDFLGANENIKIVVRGSQYHLDLVRTLISKHLERLNPFTKKSRWESRLETSDEKEIGGKYSHLIPRVFIACNSCDERVDERSVDFFLDNEADERNSLGSVELLLKLRELARAVQKRPTRIDADLFHSTLVILTRMNPFRVADRELPEIFEVMSQIEYASRQPGQENYRLEQELRTLGFGQKMLDISKRMLAVTGFQYDYDFSKPPEFIKKQAEAITEYLQWTSARSCEAIFESVRAE